MSTILGPGQWADMHANNVEPYVNLVGIWWTGVDGVHYLAVGGPHEYHIQNQAAGPAFATVTREELERLFR